LEVPGPWEDLLHPEVAVLWEGHPQQAHWLLEEVALSEAHLRRGAVVLWEGRPRQVVAVILAGGQTSPWGRPRFCSRSVPFDLAWFRPCLLLTDIAIATVPETISKMMSASRCLHRDAYTATITTK